MRRWGMCLIACGVVTVGACTSDDPVSPGNQSTKDDIAATLQLQSAASIRSEIRLIDARLAAPSQRNAADQRDLAQRRAALSDRLAGSSETPAAAASRRPALSADESSDPSMTLILRDPSVTYTHMYLSENSVYGSMALTPAASVTGAILGMSVGGTVTQSGYEAAPFSGSWSSTIPIAAYSTSWDTPSIDCVNFGGTGTATTTHTAGATIQTFGWTLDTWSTYGSDQCTSSIPVAVQLAQSSISVNSSTTAIVANNSQCVPSWGSSNPAVASVSGIIVATITGNSAGTAYISAGCPGMRLGEALISVTLADGACDDMAAQNYGAVGPCTYPPQLCEDPTASDYEQPGECTYPPPTTCTDPTAENDGGALPCVYPPPPELCDDPDAENYNQPGDCAYPPPPDPGDPGGGGGGGGGGFGGGGPDDPCFDNPADPSCVELQDSRIPRFPVSGRPSIAANFLSVSRSLSGSSSSGQAPYYFELAGAWVDPSVVAIVGRFRHNGGYVDAIYLPASNATATAWALAVRALQEDRASAADPNATRRVIRIRADGTQRLSRNDGPPTALHQWTSLSSSAASNIDGQFRKGVMNAVKRATKKRSSGMGLVQMIKWPHQ